jgi:hypothetical protein
VLSTSRGCDPTAREPTNECVDVHALAAPRALPRDRSSLTASPWAIAFTVAAVYAVLLVPGLLQDPNQFANIGREFLNRGTTSAAIKPSFHTVGKIGYDGQFYYFLALDPKHGKDDMEAPGLIYSRIGYPMTVRALSAGKASVIPYMMVLVNIAAAVGGTLAVAFFLRRHGLPPLLALLYGFFPGLWLAVSRDLTEPLAFCLAAAGLVVFDPQSKKRLLGSAALFGLAMLTRETVALFPAVLALALLVGAGSTATSWGDRLRIGNLLRAAAFAEIAFLPLFAWRHVVTIWIHTTAVQERPAGGPAGGVLYSLAPFHAMAAQWPWSAEDVVDLLTVVVPAVVWAVIAIVLLLRRRWSPALWLVLINAAVFVVFLPSPVAVEYISMGRASIGVVLAVLIALPQVMKSLGEKSKLCFAALSLWSLPYYLLISGLLHGVVSRLV